MKASLLMTGALKVAPAAEKLVPTPSQPAQGDTAFCAELADAIIKGSKSKTSAMKDDEAALDRPEAEAGNDDSEKDPTSEVQLAGWCFFTPLEIPVAQPQPAVQICPNQGAGDPGELVTKLVDAPPLSNSTPVQTSPGGLDALLPVTAEMAAAVRKNAAPSSGTPVSPENAAGQGGVNCPPIATGSKDFIETRNSSENAESEELSSLQPGTDFSKRLENGPETIRKHSELGNSRDNPESKISSLPGQNMVPIKGAEASGTVVAPGDARMNLPQTAQMNAESAAPEVALASPSELTAKVSRQMADQRKAGGTDDLKGVPYLQESSPDGRTASFVNGAEESHQPGNLAPVRLAHSIMHEVSALKALKGGSMSVVLKPDAATQLSVRLEYRDGAIEALATCDRGDYGLLQSQWPDLRRVLESQGIRLGDLERGADANASFQQGTGDSSRKHAQAEPSTEERNFVSVSVTKPSITSPAAQRVATASRLLESWA